ncbi:ribosome biogenesis factor YjgA [Teredinibacter haidensis]|uniref:ribosome biogenesis factor YjgA n=1 Tax=Teredinibacter haidensis TaxID=2731755 RepID=UPI0009491CCF|nr:ribosome biogenesis factor YjgA [Teredinibacter haidensis]
MTEDEYEDFDDGEFGKSKTRVKQEMQALQELGVKITELKASQQAQIPMDDKLRKAIEEAPRITHHSGRKRHMQFIGKLMRAADGEAIEQAYQKLMEKQHQSVQLHHQMERWRDRLLVDEKALPEFIEQFPLCDRQQLRQLIRASQKERSQQKPPVSTRKLFKFIRDCFED